MSRIAVVLVTYNRLSLLKEVTLALKKQTHKPDAIIIVNNDSNDGTTEWLNSQNELIVIHQENTGGAGGMHTGIKYAYEREYDWIWLMDDDVEPEPTCLEALVDEAKKGGFQILQPNRLTSDNKIWKYSSKLNLTNPFKREGLLDIDTIETYKETKQIISFPFEGPFISRKVIEKIGLPDKRLFIWYDDTEYSLRTHKYGLKIGLCYGAIIKRKIAMPIPSNATKPDWKLFYEVRNQIIIDRKFSTFLVTVLRLTHQNSKRVARSAYFHLLKNRRPSVFVHDIKAIFKGIYKAFIFKLEEDSVII